MSNESFAYEAVNFSQDEINNIIRQVDERDVATLADVRRLALDGLDDVIDDLPGVDDNTEEEIRRLRELVRNGDPNAVRERLNNEAEASAAGRELIARATAVRLLDDIAATIMDGTLDGGDLAALIDGVQLFPQAARADVLNDFGQIAVNQQLVIWLVDTQPGVRDLPFGFDLPIALIPGLPQDILLPLDGGPVLAGIGAPGDAILLGTGNPWQAGGMPIALPDAQPAPAFDSSYADGVMVIANPTDEMVNYNIDNRSLTLSPQYEQTLSGASSWIIEFDRGGSYGMAKYRLYPGYYRFKLTDRGWDLFKAKFTCSLDNSGNEFTFNYVLDNQQQVLAPGEIHDLSGPMPPVITFDNGRGEEEKVKLDSGTYRVAVGSDQALGIFAADDVSNSSPSSLAASTDTEPVKEVAIAGQTNDSTKRPVSSSVRPVVKKPASLPAGFKLFDPVEPLTDPKQAKSLPKEFTLFRSAVNELARNDK